MEEQLPLIEMNRDPGKRYEERGSRFLNETEYSREKRLKLSAAGGSRKKDGNWFENCCDSLYKCTRTTGNTIFCADMCTECCNACNSL